MQVISADSKERLRQKVANQKAYVPVTKIQHATLKEKKVYYQIVVWHEEVENKE